MGLSRLQKYILTKCYYEKNGIVGKRELYDFYSKSELEKKINIQVVLQKSIETLVKKDLLISHGHKTAKKWFVHKVRITSRGKKIIKQLIKKRQRKLPIK